MSELNDESVVVVGRRRGGHCISRGGGGGGYEGGHVRGAGPGQGGGRHLVVGQRPRLGHRARGRGRGGEAGEAGPGVQGSMSCP